MQEHIAANTLQNLTHLLQGHEDVVLGLRKDSVKQNGYITKHDDYVSGVAFHPNYKDNNLVASAGIDGKIKLISSNTGTVRKVWSPNYGPACALIFSPDHSCRI